MGCALCPVGSCLQPLSSHYLFKRSQWPKKLRRYDNHTHTHTHAHTHTHEYIHIITREKQAHNPDQSTATCNMHMMWMRMAVTLIRMWRSYILLQDITYTFQNISEEIFLEHVHGMFVHTVHVCKFQCALNFFPYLGHYIYFSKCYKQDIWVGRCLSRWSVPAINDGRKWKMHAI